MEHVRESHPVSTGATKRGEKPSTVRYTHQEKSHSINIHPLTSTICKVPNLPYHGEMLLLRSYSINGSPSSLFPLVTYI